jgi:hypothetical protein
MLFSALALALSMFSPEPAMAVSQSDLTLLPKCEAKIRKAVEERFGKGDETFSISSVRLIYGGSKGGLHISPVVIVQTSDEVEPRDILVLANWVSSDFVRREGCKIDTMKVVADGTVIDFEE